MSSRALKPAPSAPLRLTPGACRAGRRVYRAAARRVIGVPSGGMAPAIKPGDMAAAEDGYHRDRPVGRFDIVTFRPSPEHSYALTEGMDAGAEYVERVVGLGGEAVETRSSCRATTGRTASTAGAGRGRRPGSGT